MSAHSSSHHHLVRPDERGRHRGRVQPPQGLPCMIEQAALELIPIGVVPLLADVPEVIKDHGQHKVGVADETQPVQHRLYPAYPLRVVIDHVVHILRGKDIPIHVQVKARQAREVCVDLPLQPLRLSTHVPPALSFSAFFRLYNSSILPPVKNVKKTKI